jgi:4-diphosphocytidyl-2-C-methyl-D-erythritol kinase
VADRRVISAPAKLNLALRVGRREDDGYHPIASLMVALDGLEDKVTLTHAATRRLVCPGAPEGPANLAWRALDALEAHVGRTLPAHITITKRIPLQAGLGGGSSDAAAVLVGVNDLYELDLPAATLESVGAEVGSDVPFFVRGGTQWATGRGERLVQQPLPRDLWALVCGPVVALSTADVYRAFDRLGSADDLDPRPPSGAWVGAPWVTNELWRAARALAPALGQTADQLLRHGADHAILCGSGGAIAGLWSDRDRAVAAAGQIESVLALVCPGAPRADGDPDR